MIPLLLVLSAVGRAAPEPPSACLVKLRDPAALLAGAPELRLVDSAGGEFSVRPKDDGVTPDATANDGIYSDSLGGVAPGEVTVRLSDGAEEWTCAASLELGEEQPELILELSATGLVEGEREERLDRVSGGSAVISGGPGQPEVKVAVDPWHGSWLWFVLLGGFGLGAGAMSSRLLHRRPRGIVLVPAPPAGNTCPRRLSGEQTLALLAGPLAGHRVVVVGDLPAGAPPVHRCADGGVLPWEVVGAVERLAVVAGGPVALLVTRRADLEAPIGEDPSMALAAAVADRFPLWVADGPAAWKDWMPEGGGRD